MFAESGEYVFPRIDVVWRVGENDVVGVACEPGQCLDGICLVGRSLFGHVSGNGLLSYLCGSSAVDFYEVDVRSAMFEEVKADGSSAGVKVEHGHSVCAVRTEHRDDG